MFSIDVTTNDSPLRGSEGGVTTLLDIRKRLVKETENDVALKIPDSDKKNIQKSIKVSGRGDLHLGILFEKMRREGFEFSIFPPEIAMKNIKGVIHEPIELVTIEVEEAYERGIIDKMQQRKASLVTCDKVIKGKRVTTKLVFQVTSRGFIGCRSEIMSETKGTALISSEFHSYEKHKGQIKRNVHGAILSLNDGKATAFALADIEKKGRLFIGPGASVYTGLVIGENSVESDVEMNPCKQKRLTNVRTHDKEEAINLQQFKAFSIDEALSYIRDDEQVEVTPKSIRIRKKILNPQVRRRIKRDAKTQETGK